MHLAIITRLWVLRKVFTVISRTENTPDIRVPLSFYSDSALNGPLLFPITLFDYLFWLQPAHQLFPCRGRWITAQPGKRTGDIENQCPRPRGKGMEIAWSQERAAW